MTLRAKVIIAISAALALLLIVVYATSRVILLNSFARLENAQVTESTLRGESALLDEIARLNSVAGDWALWDDTYNFVEGADVGYIQANLMEETFINLKLNLMVFLDLSGKIVYAKAFDFQSKVGVEMPQGLQEYLSVLPSSDVLLRHADANSSVSGVLLLPEARDPLLVASRPIMKSGGKSLIRGTLVVGRFLDSATIAQMARSTYLDLSVLRLDKSGLPLSDRSPFLVRPLNGEKVVGYGMLKDIYAQPSIVLSVELRRDVYQQGQASMTYINWSLVIVGLVFILMTMLLWDRLALTRLMRLSADVSDISKGGLAARVQVTGKDELSSVASSINRMLDELQHSAEALRESEGRFRRLAENAQDMIFRFRMSPSPGFEYVSPAATHITGYVAEEFYADPHLWIKLIHPDDRLLFESAIRTSTLLARPSIFRWRRKDGEIIYVEQRNVPICDEQGDLLAFEGIAREITDRKLAEEALRESEERFRRQATELRALYEASLQLSAHLETVVLLRVITEQAVELLHPRASGLYIYDPQRNELVLSFAVNYFDESRLVKPGQGLIGQTFQSRRSMYWPSEQDKSGGERGTRLAVPLLGTDSVLGVLDMVGAESVFEKHNIQLAELFAAQAAVALEKAHLHDRVQRHVRELAALNRASQAILSTLDLQAVLGLVIAECRSLLNAEGMSVLLYEQMTGELVFAAVDSPGAEQLTGRRIPATLGIAGWVLQEKQAALIHDVHSDPRFYAQIDAVTGMTTRSLLAAPLMTKGTIIGVIEAINKVDDAFDQHDLETLEAMASSAAIAAENARLYQMEKEQRELAETLREVGATLVSTLDVATVLDRLLEQISRVVPHDTANIMLIEGERARIVRRRGYDRFGIDTSDAPASYPIASIPNLQQMIETGEPVVIPDTHTNPNWISRSGVGEWHRSYAGVPIRVRGRGIGFLNVHSARPGFYDYSDAERLRAFADQAAIALENARLFGEERKTADRLQALSRRLVEVQEVERSRIARELHDEAGQSLTSLMVHLRLLEHEARHPDRVLALTGELKQMADGVLENLHRLAVDLRPASLDHLGLVAALRQYIETFCHQHNMIVQFEAVRLDDTRMPMEVETALYRIVQEALTNVARHAQATQADVILERRGDRLILIIEDNGVGFDPDVAVPGDRLGMVGMKERAEMLGGDLEVESEIGKGTTIRVEVPYAHSHPDS